jgi:hypothetical protein
MHQNTAALRRPNAVHGYMVSISPGELLDKITILEMKAERMTDPAKLGHVRRELADLTKLRQRWSLSPSAASRSHLWAHLTAGRLTATGWISSWLSPTIRLPLFSNRFVVKSRQRTRFWHSGMLRWIGSMIQTYELQTDASVTSGLVTGGFFNLENTGDPSQIRGTGGFDGRRPQASNGAAYGSCRSASTRTARA